MFDVAVICGMNLNGSGILRRPLVKQLAEMGSGELFNLTNNVLCSLKWCMPAFMGFAITIRQIHE